MLTKRGESERNFLISIAVLAAVFLAGTAGYSYIEGWPLIDSLYMTVITLTTIGFREVHELDGAGRVFTIVLVVFGVGTVAVTVRNATKMMLEGELKHIFGRKKLENRIKKLKDHYIICGFGRMGRFICRDLAARPVPFVVIEKDAGAFSEDDWDRYLIITGDADQDETLVEAGIKRAKGLISVVSTDADNLYIVLTARGLNPNLLIVARAGDEGSEHKLMRAGATKVISPYQIGAHRISQAVLRPTVVDFIEFATRYENIELNIEEVRVGDGSPLAGRELNRSGIRSDLGIIIVAIKAVNGKMEFNPSPDRVLDKGDTLVALGPPEKLKMLDGITRGIAAG